MRPPLPTPQTLDGNMLTFRNAERIRYLLSLFSRDEITQALAEIVEAGAAKVETTDSRLSDARTPLLHGSSRHDTSVEATANKGAASGYCELDAGTKVPTNRLGTGTPTSSVFLRGDRTWSSPTAPGIVPIGAILPWHKSLSGVPNLPAEFLECNGQVVSDAASPLDGQTLPNLNGAEDNRFLRGNSTSGGTGGQTYHEHTSQDTFASAGGCSFDTNGDGSVQTGLLDGASVNAVNVTSTDVWPPYFDVVWLIRIK